MTKHNRCRKACTKVMGVLQKSYPEFLQKSCPIQDRITIKKLFSGEKACSPSLVVFGQEGHAVNGVPERRLPRKLLLGAVFE